MLHLYRAAASFFPIRGLNSQKKFFTQSCTNILGILVRCLKTKFQANKTTKGNAFIIELFKIYSGLKIYGGIETSSSLLGAAVLIYITSLMSLDINIQPVNAE